MLECIKSADVTQVKEDETCLILPQELARLFIKEFIVGRVDSRRKRAEDVSAPVNNPAPDNALRIHGEQSSGPGGFFRQVMIAH